MWRATKASDLLTNALLILDPADKLAEGVERLVFAHPTDPTRLVKVIKHRPTSKFTRWTFSHLTQRYIPSARYRPTVKQYDEYRRLMFANLETPDFTLPISHLYGFVPTNLGLGGISERVTDSAGNNAPTLASMMADGFFDADDLERLNAFVQTLYDVSVCAADLNAANFVYGHRHIGTLGQKTDKQWVLIDGFGDKYAVPIRTIWAKARTKGLDDRFKRAKKVDGLNWNAEKRMFELRA